jgi:hypothetical protein
MINYWDKIREIYKYLQVKDPDKYPKDLWTEAYQKMKEQGH